jgi:hypothetical protein
MFVIVSRYLVPKGFGGLTVFPFIFVGSKISAEDQVFVNHEKIHIRQQLELLIIPFFLWYAFEFLIRLVQYKSRAAAYKNISFEREAYAHEKSLSYLKKRPFWNFLRYLC